MLKNNKQCEGAKKICLSLHNKSSEPKIPSLSSLMVAAIALIALNIFVVYLRSVFPKAHD